MRFPLIYTNPADQDIHHYFGVAKVDILPPERLFHPVLPVRSGSKLTFPLCAACVQEEQCKPWLQRTNLCSHTDAERKLRGTWATTESCVSGVPDVEDSRSLDFREEDRRVGLFADYVNTWLKIKQESAGWPDNCTTLQQKREYIREYKQKEGIKLENVAKNPGRKQVAKLLLNR